MKYFHLSITCALAITCLCLAGCGKSNQSKAKTEDEVTKDGMRDNPGNYTPAPLNTSMTPHVTPKAAEGEK